MKKFNILVFLFSFLLVQAQISDLLHGNIIRYPVNKTSSKNVFDNNPNTFLEATIPTGSWVGLDLGSPHVITQIEFIAGKNNMQTGIFEASNDPDFKDAVPLYMIKEKTTKLTTYKAFISVSKGFRYIRYFGATNSYCVINEMKLYGYKGEGTDSKYLQITNLPTLIINTNTKEDITSKTEYQAGTIRIVSGDGKIIFTQELKIRGRGNGSWNAPKKGFRIKLDKKAKLLDAPATSKDWTLIAGYEDKSLIRSVLAFDISKKTGFHYTPYARLIDLVVNGNYRGTYMLCDQIEVNPKRVNIEKVEDDDVDSSLTGGYLIEIDAYAYTDSSVPLNSVFTSSKGIPVTIKYPKNDKIVEKQNLYIKNQFNSFEEALFSQNFTNHNNQHYQDILDIKSFSDYFVYEEFIGNPDAFWSTYMIKKRDDAKFYTGPAWDFDLSMDNDSRVAPINSIDNFLSLTKASTAGSPSLVSGYFNLYDPNSYKRNMKEILLRLMEDPSFKTELYNSWKSLRQEKGLTKKYLFEKIKSLKKEVNESQKLNSVRWPDGAIPKRSYDAEVDFVLNYNYNRLKWMDNMLNYSPTNENDLLTYTPVEISGFNSDIVAESKPIDNHISRAISSDYFVCYTSKVLEKNSLPDDRILKSSKFNAIYKLAPYNAKQTSYIKQNESVELKFVEPQNTKGLSILATSANGNSTLIVTIRYTDQTTQEGFINVDDWWFSKQIPAISGLGQVQAYNAGSGIHNTFRLYEYPILTDINKTIESVSFKNLTQSRPFIFAISSIYSKNRSLQKKEVSNIEEDQQIIIKSNKKEVDIWPNPIYQGETIHIKSENISEIELYSLLRGNLIKTIKSSTQNTNNIKMDVEKGIYLLQIIFKDNTDPIRKKVIVK